MGLPLVRHVVNQLCTMDQVVLRATSFRSLYVVFAQYKSAAKRMCVCNGFSVPLAANDRVSSRVAYGTTLTVMALVALVASKTLRKHVPANISLQRGALATTKKCEH